MKRIFIDQSGNAFGRNQTKTLLGIETQSRPPEAPELVVQAAIKLKPY